jgi:hypothetical protein
VLCKNWHAAVVLVLLLSLNKSKSTGGVLPAVFENSLCWHSGIIEISDFTQQRSCCALI